jgi:hypothetical protein
MLSQIAVWVGLVAGVAFIVAAIFSLGYSSALAATSTVAITATTAGCITRPHDGAWQ